MPLSLRAPTPLEYFASLVASDDQFPLLEAAASLAMDEYPELDVQRVPGEMDLLLARLKRRVARAVEPAQMLQTLNRYFFGDLGFGGNSCGTDVPVRTGLPAPQAAQPCAGDRRTPHGRFSDLLVPGFG